MAQREVIALEDDHCYPYNWEPLSCEGEHIVRRDGYRIGQSRAGYPEGITG